MCAGSFYYQWARGSLAIAINPSRNPEYGLFSKYRAVFEPIKENGARSSLLANRSTNSILLHLASPERSKECSVCRRYLRIS